MKLRALLTTARKSKGLSLRALEAQTGLSNSLLSQIETGWIEEPSFRKIVKIAKALDISLERLAKAE